MILLNRKEGVKNSITLRDMNNQLCHIDQLREQAEARLSVATSYSQDMILRCREAALEDKWVDSHEPINEIIARCSEQTPSGTTALQQISFEQKAQKCAGSASS